MANESTAHGCLGAKDLGKIDADAAAYHRFGVKERFGFPRQDKNTAAIGLNHPDDFNTGIEQQSGFG